MRQILSVFALVSLAALSACGGATVGQTLGLERKAPDEFRVLSRPPLNVPPEFNLRAPTDGSESGLIAPASRQAEDAVFGYGDDVAGSSLPQEGYGPTAILPVTSSDAASQTDQNFLNRAGASAADSDIRQTLREENGNTGYEEEEKSILEKLREPSKKEPTVDAIKEAERIKENDDEGKHASDGEVEVKEPKDRGILDKLDNIF